MLMKDSIIAFIVIVKGIYKYDVGEMHVDHILPWSKGSGKSVDFNCQMLCCYHNKSKNSRWWGIVKL